MYALLAVMFQRAQRHLHISERTSYCSVPVITFSMIADKPAVGKTMKNTAVMVHAKAERSSQRFVRQQKWLHRDAGDSFSSTYSTFIFMVREF